ADPGRLIRARAVLGTGRMRSALCAGLLALATSARADGLVEVTSFGDNPGALRMFEHVPADLPTGRPLVVVLHGCSMSAADMQHEGWDALADLQGFAVVY